MSAPMTEIAPIGRSTPARPHRRHRQAPRRDDGAARHRPRDRAGRVLRAARALGLGQDDDAAHPRRPRVGERGPRADGRRRRDDEGARRARRRDGVPELRALSAHDGGAEHRLPAEDGRHAARRDRARGRRRPPAKVGIGHLLRAHAGPALRRPAAARARWRARSSASRGCSCSTSRCPTSTPSCASRPASSCTSCSARSASTTVYVTHDQEEAMTLADRIAVFMDGRIVQVGTPREIFATAADGRRRRLHRHAADEPAAGDVGGRDAVSVGGVDAAGRRRPSPTPRDVDARRAARRPARRRRRPRRRASSASRTSATARIVNLLGRRAAAQAEERPRCPTCAKATTSPSASRPTARAPVRRRRPARASPEPPLHEPTNDHERQPTANAERRPDPQRRHGLLRPRLLRRRDRDAEPRPPRRRTACASRSSTTPRAAARRARRCSPGCTRTRPASASSPTTRAPRATPATSTSAA